MRAAGVALCVLALLAACDDMTDQPRQKTYSPEVGPAQQPKGVVEYDKAPSPAPPLTLALLERGQALRGWWLVAPAQGRALSWVDVVAMLAFGGLATGLGMRARRLPALAKGAGWDG